MNGAFFPGAGFWRVHGLQARDGLRDTENHPGRMGSALWARLTDYWLPCVADATNAERTNSGQQKGESRRGLKIQRGNSGAAPS